MPARRTNRLPEVLLVNNTLCSRHLTGQVFDLKKQTNVEEECSICLESLMCCRTCYTLLICGHAFHSSCYHIHAQASDECPVCRQ